MSGVTQPLAPGVATLSGTKTIGYIAPISVDVHPVSPGAFGEWRAVEGGGRRYVDATQVVFRPPEPGQ
jgi:hypothetical protein